jgi:small subunit ribosomal protein S3
MGHKVNPTSYRLPLNLDWQSKWFAGKDYAKLLLQDVDIRKFVEKKHRNAGIESVYISRGTNEVLVTIKTAKPGLIIGRSGMGSTDLKLQLEKITSGHVRLSIEEVKKIDTSASLVAQSIASQIERRVSYRRAMRQAVEKAMSAGAKGIKICVSGRLNGAEIARSEKIGQGSVTLATLRSNIDYYYTPAQTTYGVIGIKVWIYKGEPYVNA